MRIINAMFGCKKGGIEQAFLDYGAALSRQGNEVIALVHPNAQILPTLIQSDIGVETVSNYGSWDIAAVWKLRQLIRQAAPDCIITHGNRAAILMGRAAPQVPIIGVCHNYNLKHLIGLHALLAITDDLRKAAIKAGQPEGTVFKVPNMIHVPQVLETRNSVAFREPPVIGAMGRFVKKKGLEVFLQALAILKKRGVSFQAVIGGSGREDGALRKSAHVLGLGNEVNFTGWVEDKNHFFKECDIFCLPSLHEPFGIVLLEAFLHALPVVTTDSEGPVEIAQDGKDALIVPRGDAQKMADAIERLIGDRKLAARIAMRGLSKVTKYYSSQVVGEQLNRTIEAAIDDVPISENSYCPVGPFASPGHSL